MRVETSRLIIQGHVSKRYFTKDQIVIHFEEEALLRKSTTIKILSVSGEEMTGTVSSTIANSRGTVRWVKGSDDNEFSSQTDA